MQLIRLLGGDRPFLKNFSILLSSSIVGSAISAGTMLLLPKLYSPEAFETLAIFTAITSVCGVVACLRYEIAIPLAKTDHEAGGLTVLALGLAFLTSATVCMALIALASNSGAARHLQAHLPIGYVWAIPLTIFFLASSSVGQLLLTKAKAFRLLAVTRVAQAGSSGSTQLALGFFGFGGLGLIIGQIMHSLAGGLILSIYIAFKKRLEILSPRQLRTLAAKHKNFPKYSTLEALLNISGIQVPIFLIAILSDGPEAGHLALAMYFMNIPMLLLGGPISQIYYSEAKGAFDQGRLTDLNLLMIKRLSTLGLGPLIFIAFISKFGFESVYGEEWSRAGEIARYLVPWYFLQLLASPISSVLININSAQRMAVLIQVAGFSVRIMMVVMALLFMPSATIEIFALSGAIFYALYLALLWKLAPASIDRVADAVIGDVRVLLLCLALCFLLQLALV